MSSTDVRTQFEMQLSCLFQLHMDFMAIASFNVQGHARI